MNLIFTLIRLVFISSCVMGELLLEAVHVRLVKWNPQPTVLEAVKYGAPRPWLANYLPGVARLFNVVKEATKMFTCNSLQNQKSFKPVSKE